MHVALSYTLEGWWMTDNVEKKANVFALQQLCFNCLVRHCVNVVFICLCVKQYVTKGLMKKLSAHSFEISLLDLALPSESYPNQKSIHTPCFC